MSIFSLILFLLLSTLFLLHRSKYRFLRHDSDPRVFILTIIDVQTSDGGEYECGETEVNVLVVIAAPTCAIYGGGGAASRLPGSRSHFRRSILNPLDVPPRTSGGSSSVEEGAVATLTCRVASSATTEAAPKLIWRLASTSRDFLLGEQIKNAARNVTSNVLRFRAAAADDGHKYFCQVRSREKLMGLVVRRKKWFKIKCII